MDEQIARRIKRQRQERNMTQQDLADAADLSQTAVSAIERGAYSDIGVKTLRSIAHALRVPIEALLNDPAPPEPLRTASSPADLPVAAPDLPAAEPSAA